MAKFAEYYFHFKNNKGSYDWDKRQEHLAAIFEKDDSIVFREGKPSKDQISKGLTYAKTFKHRVYHLQSNHNIIIMQFANSIDTPMEIDYEETIVKNEPSCFVIIDNRKGMRTVAIQNRRKAFSAPQQVARILTEEISRTLFNEHCYEVEILPKYYPKDLFQAWDKLQRHVQKMKFHNTCSGPVEEIQKRVDELKDKPYYSNLIVSHMLQMALAAKEAKYVPIYEVSRENPKEPIYVDFNSEYMRGLITCARATNTPVELVTTDGTAFECFVELDEENTDKIVHKELDSDLLEMLFKNKKKDGEECSNNDIIEAEEKIVEMLNEIKISSDDIAAKEEVA